MLPSAMLLSRVLDVSPKPGDVLLSFDGPRRRAEVCIRVSSAVKPIPSTHNPMMLSRSRVPV